MPGDIPMYKKEEKNSQTHMLDQEYLLSACTVF